MDAAQYSSALYALACVGVVLFQIGLIAGLPWGHLTQGGRFKGSLPASGRFAAALSIVLLICMAYSMLSFSGLVSRWPVWTAWVTLGIQALSMLMNWITPSRSERFVWGPITTLMFGLALIILFGAL